MNYIFISFNYQIIFQQSQSQFAVIIQENATSTKLYIFNIFEIDKSANQQSICVRCFELKPTSLSMLLFLKLYARISSIKMYMSSTDDSMVNCFKVFSLEHTLQFIYQHIIMISHSSKTVCSHNVNDKFELMERVIRIRVSKSHNQQTLRWRFRFENKEYIVYERVRQ